MAFSKRQFTLNLEVDDEQSTDLPILIEDARRIRELMGLQAVRFTFEEVIYTVTKLNVVKRVIKASDSDVPEVLYAKVKMYDGLLRQAEQQKTWKEGGIK